MTQILHTQYPLNQPNESENYEQIIIENSALEIEANKNDNSSFYNQIQEIQYNIGKENKVSSKIIVNQQQFQEKTVSNGKQQSNNRQNHKRILTQEKIENPKNQDEDLKLNQNIISKKHRKTKTNSRKFNQDNTEQTIKKSKQKITNCESRLYYDNQVDLISNSNNIQKMKFLLKRPAIGKTLRFIIKKFYKGILKYVEIDLFEENTNEHLIKAVKLFSSTINYKLYVNQQQNHIAQLESNFFRTNFTAIYNKQSKMINSNYQNEIFLNVIYQSNYTPKISRNISIYLNNPSTIKQDNRNLQKKYHTHPNSILKLVNKKPKWDQITQCYKLNFQGRVKKASSKNLILIYENQQNKPLLIFGKKQQQIYNLDIRYPLNVLEGFSIILTNLDFKYI